MTSDMNTMLLQRLTAGNGAKPPLHEMVAQLAEDDPRMGLVAQFLASREQAPVIELEEEDTQAAERREALQRLERTVKKLYSELEQLRERSDSLAAALGACYLCWGEDRRCELCGGQGWAGWQPRDPALFNEWIAPALRTGRSRPARPSEFPVHPEPGTPHPRAGLRQPPTVNNATNPPPPERDQL